MKRFKSLNLIVGHSDGMGGAKPVGNFLAIQGMVSAILPLWLSVWVLLQWTHPSVFWAFQTYLGMHSIMLLVALGFFWCSFVWPFFNIIKLYQGQRRKLIDIWSNRIHQEITAQNGPDQQGDALQTIENNRNATEALEAVKGMAVVPLGFGLQSLFSLSMALPALALILPFFDPSGKLTTILDLLSDIFAKF